MTDCELTNFRIENKLLAEELEKHREAIRRLADQDATLSVCDGRVIVTMDATLTDAEWEAVWLAIGMFAEGPEHIKRHEEMADALRGLLERLGGAK
jgi:hypothetical protein